MSKIVYICSKDKNILKPNIEILSRMLIPDNIKPRPPKTIINNGIHAIIINPSDSILVKNDSICAGNLLEEGKGEWWEPRCGIPDGSFALFKSNAEYVEIITDVVGSRTVWYYHNENYLIASTSQRSIIYCLKNFQFNHEVIPWMLSTGTTGPGNSWDKRIQCIPADSSLLLNREKWTIDITINPCVFSQKKLLKDFAKHLLKEALDETFNCLKLDNNKWILPLSGGYDSRYILYSLKNRNELNCITWGLKKSLHEKENDAYLAKKVLKFLRKKFNYFELDDSDEPAETIINRFLIAGEGRIDHISGYTDGFKIWKYLFNNNIQGIIRGDEGFGWKSIFTKLGIRRSLGIRLLSDYKNYNELVKFNLPKQFFPDNLKRNKTESLNAWRDRLYHQFRIPVYLAALNDLKLSYVEITNPLLSKKIIRVVRTLPDNFRNDKKLFKAIVREKCKDIPIAKYPAIGNRVDFVKRKDVTSLILKEFESSVAQDIFNRDFIKYISKKITPSTNHKKKSILHNINLRKMITQFIPENIREQISDSFIKEKIDVHLFAFRMFIIIRVYQIFTNDCNRTVF